MEKVNVVLTDEIKNRMKKSLGFKIRNDFLYTPKAYREKDENGNYLIPKEYWPVFKLRAMMGIDFAKIENGLIGDVTLDKNGKPSGFKLQTGTLKIEICKKCILTWVNYRDEDFNLIDAPKHDEITGLLSDDSINRLHPDHLQEISDAVQNHSTLTEEELLGLEL